MHFNVSLDWGDEVNAGPTGTFQVVDLTDDDDRSYTKYVDQSHHYHNLDELRQDLAKNMHLPEHNVFIDEI